MRPAAVIAGPHYSGGAIWRLTKNVRAQVMDGDNARGRVLDGSASLGWNPANLQPVPNMRLLNAATHSPRESRLAAANRYCSFDSFQFHGSRILTHWYFGNQHICRDRNKDFCNATQMEYGERLRYALERAGMSQSDLARNIGVYPQAIQYLCSGKARRSQHTRRISQVLGVSQEWLESGQGPVASNVGRATPVEGKVPLISWVAAGAFCGISDPYEIGDAEEWLPSPIPGRPKMYALRVRGASMEPKFRDGEIIFVDPDTPADSGRYVVVRIEDDKEATFKQLIVEGGRKYLKALNPQWPNPIIEVHSEAVICGVALFKGELL